MKKMVTTIFWLVLVCSRMMFADWKTSTPVGPGVILHHEFREIGPWHIQMLEIDLREPLLKLESVKANDRILGNEKTSAMAARNDAEGHRIVGAINADFYATGGEPIGAQVIKGTLLKMPYPRSIFAVTARKKPCIDIVGFDGKIITSRGGNLTIHGVNKIRDLNQLILYNAYFGASTQTNFWGTEITTRYLEPDFAVNDTMRLVVVAKDSILATGHGNNAIPRDGLILSGHEQASELLNRMVFVGDTLSVVLRLPPLQDRIVELIGGTPRLIRDGVVSVEWQTEKILESFCTDRHPRTAIGIAQDSSRLYWLTVDGRQPGYSVGMSLYELAAYLREWKIYQAVNLDGGGSTTMVVRGQVVNSPSDAGGERAVANAIMVVSTAPTGPIARLQLAPKSVYVLANTRKQFAVTGTDSYYNTIPLAPGTTEWSCPPGLGQVDPTGLFTAAADTGVGYIIARVGSVRDSAQVIITRIHKIQLQPDPVVLKIGASQQMLTDAYDNRDNKIDLALTEYQWSLDGAIGSVSASGLVTATALGSGTVSAQYQQVIGSARIQIGVTTRLVVDNFNTSNNWTLSGSRVNLGDCALTTDATKFVSAPASARLDYSLTTGGTSALYLNAALAIAGQPDAVGIQVYGDGKGHWLRGEFEDADQEKFLINFTEATPGVDWDQSWRYLQIPLSQSIIHWGNPSASLTFPIKWTKIYLAETKEQHKDKGTLYLDDFTFHYTETSINQGEQNIVPVQFHLGQNYPNPFNATTIIPYEMAQAGQVQLTVFDALGQHVATLVDAFQHPGAAQVFWHGQDQRGRPVSSGTYFYQCCTSCKRETRKMLFLR